jgi:hypothetical protein
VGCAGRPPGDGGAALLAAGFVDVAFDTAAVVHEDGKGYGVLLGTALRA